MAKPGLKKKFINMAKKGAGTAKTLFKRALALQKRNAKGPARKTTKKIITKKRGTSMAKTKTKTVVKYRTRAPAKVAPRRKQRVNFMRNKVVNASVNAVVTGGAAIASAAAINMTPKVQDLKAWQKALILGGGGGTGLFFIRNLWAKKLFAGVMLGGVLTWLLPVVKKQFPEWQLFGPVNKMNAGLTNYQRSRLGEQGKKYSVRNMNTKAAGPVNEMRGPWPNSDPGNMGCMGDMRTNSDNNFMSVVG